MFEHISTDQVKALIQEPNHCTLVDIRSLQAFNAGHIPGAFHLTDENVEDFLAQTKRDSPIICYCYRGHSSQQAAAFLANQGFDKVYSMDGGYEAWRV